MEALGVGRRNRIFSVLLISTTISSLLQTSLSTVLPAIMRDFSVSASSAQWLSTSYSLVTGIMVPASAFLLRRFGTRHLHLVGMMAFLAGLLICSIAKSFALMLVGRVLQAVSAGIGLSMTQVVILTIFPQEKRGITMGIYGIACSVAPAVAPALTGLVAEIFGWRMIFQGSLVLYSAAFIFALFAMEDVLEAKAAPFDIVSFLLCGIGFSGVTIGVGNVSDYPFFSVVVALPLLIGVVALTLFTMRQSGRDDPFLDLRVLNDKNCRVAVIISVLLYAGLIAGSTLIPMYAQMIRGLSSSVTGLTMMPGSFAMVLISPLTGKLYDKFGIRGIAVCGATIMMASCLGYCFVDGDTPISLLVALFILRNIAVGCVMMPIVTWGVSTLPTSMMAHGTAVLTSLRTISGGIGSALFVAVLTFFSRGTAASTAVSVSEVGMRAAFVALAITSIMQLAVSVLCVRDKARLAKRLIRSDII